MVNIIQDSEAVFLTYRDVRENNPSWTDRMIEDYLARGRDALRGTEGVEEALEDIDKVDNAILRRGLIAPRDVEGVVINANYTVPHTQVVICVNAAPITVTLNDEPDDFEMATVKRTDAELTINGNGKQIDGDTTVTLTVQYTSLDLLYTLETDEWNII